MALVASRADPADQVHTFRITVHTAPSRGAGTDGDVAIALEGDDGKMEMVCFRVVGEFATARTLVENAALR
jgi:hypothetical protein